jgi:hypothetical protein
MEQCAEASDDEHGPQRTWGTFYDEVEICYNPLGASTCWWKVQVVLPTERNVDLPLLKVLADADGPLPMSTAIDNVAKFFPKITQEDLAGRLKSGTSRWRNSVQ